MPYGPDDQQDESWTSVSERVDGMVGCVRELKASHDILSQGIYHLDLASEAHTAMLSKIWKAVDPSRQPAESPLEKLLEALVARQTRVEDALERLISAVEGARRG